MSASAAAPALLGRRRECETLSGVVAAAKAGRSQVLVLRGEAGIGKTALLDFVVRRAVGCRVSRAAGAESETELAFAGLHQLCRPYLDRLETLPNAQRDALGTAFGLRSGDVPDTPVAGLGVLTLLGAVADERPLVCVVDDLQWLDRASAQALAIVADRLADRRIALVVAVRAPDVAPDVPADLTAALAGLPELVLRGLGRSDAAGLLDAVVPGPLDPQVRERILAESRGNPLALLELPRRLTATELAFGGATDAGAPLRVHRLEQRLVHAVAQLPRQSRRLLLAAAAEPVGDAQLLRRAAERSGIGPEAAGTAEVTGLLELGDHVRFRHPLARSAIYRSATPAERRTAHRALASATDPDADPDRRAWHLARSVVGPDEDVAAELERSAGRAVARGGLAAAAAFLAESAALTPEPARRARRCLDAARAKVHISELDAASTLLATAQTGPVDESGRVRADLLHAEISFAGRGDDALAPLLAAAGRLGPLDARLARDTYVDALSAFLLPWRPGSVAGVRQVAEAALAAAPPAAPLTGDALLRALAVLFTDGCPRAAPLLRRAVRSFVEEEPGLDEGLRFSVLASAGAVSLWDEGSWDAVTRRHLRMAREAGAPALLRPAVTGRILVHLFSGDLPAAQALVDEMRFVADLAGRAARPAHYGEVCLAAVRGLDDPTERLLQQALDDARAGGEGVGVDMVQWARALLFNGGGRYPDALAAAREATEDPLRPGPPTWALVELVEAGVRSGDRRSAAAALELLTATARASGTPWALGVEASRRALLSDGGAAEELHREAVHQLGRTAVRLELARAQLLYGEWLRREGRRVDARAQLRAAHAALTAMGVATLADRAGRELLATGERVRKRTVETSVDLTAQEAHIARLVADGLTNPEIGATLYISPRTVEWHLRRIFAKLGVTSRREVRLSLGRPEHDGPA